MDKTAKPESKQLTEKQLKVINDLCEETLNEIEISRRHKIKIGILRRWLTDETFNAEIQNRIKSFHRQSELILAKYLPLAAAKLVGLMESDKEETARKACIDIISIPHVIRPANAEQTADTPQADTHLDGTTAAKLLAALASDSQPDRKSS